MRYLLSLLVCCSFVNVGFSYQDDLKDLQGVWKFDSFVKEKRESWNRMTPQELFIKDGKVALIGPDPSESPSGTLQLESSAKPKQFSIVKNGKTIFRALYVVEGKMLILLASDKDPSQYRPKQFDAKDVQSTMAIFYREKDVPEGYNFDAPPAAVVNAKARMTTLRQLGIAAHNRHSDYNALQPQASIDPNTKKPLLSWRVHLLPYLECDHIYKEFKLNEPWDSEHNKKLIEKMPKIYQVPGVKADPPFTTHYQCFVAPEKTEKNLVYTPIFRIGQRQGPTLGQVTVQDGCSNTLLFAEATNPVIWTKPEDILIDSDTGTIPVGLKNETFFFAVFADGSTMKLKKSLPDAKEYDQLLHQIIGVRDGMNNDMEKLFLEKRR